MLHLEYKQVVMIYKKEDFKSDHYIYAEFGTLLVFGYDFLPTGSMESRNTDQSKLDKSFDDIIQNSTLSVHAAEFIPKSYPIKQVLSISIGYFDLFLKVFRY